MGCLWAAALADHAIVCKTAATVTLLTRSKQDTDLCQSQGGIVLREGEQTRVVPVQAAVSSGYLNPIHTLLVCTKAQDALPAVMALRNCLSSHSRLVLLQNGIMSQRDIRRAFPDLPLYCLSTSHGAFREGPLRVVHAGQGESFLGAWSSAAMDTSAAMLGDLPQRAMRIQWDEDITGRLWKKFAVNCAINALTVIHDCRNGGLLTQPAARRDLAALVSEIEQLFAELPETPAFVSLAHEVERVLRRTADNVSSMRQDALDGKETEIAYLNGYLCELAQKHALPCPVTLSVIERLRTTLESRTP